MSWTEERIELLTRLWGEGRSASQIAAELGGVTRNAVIGKVHRLKLDNRPKGGSDESVAEITPAAIPVAVAAPSPAPVPEPVVVVAQAPAPGPEPEAAPVPQRPTPAPSIAPAAAPAPAAPRILTPTLPSTPPLRAPMPQRQPMVHSIGATALKMSPETEAFEDAQIFGHSEGGEVVPMSRNLTLVQLSERTCKWPLGDPLSPDFRFCGNHSQDSSPYCKHHARIAFQPVSERRRVR
ncbi:GcrA family cell cycle regulator [Aureimonas sp. D3]|uniref:GcrA family cell cycle regulator n=1 Tax=Aureimonas sp. D3 TaxID=1638164 RepID=UPI0007858B52|nr:GcrA family cell cycle regulator [Aureimonas sp. D3]